MTDSDLRELDGWIAEHVFQQTKPPYAHNPHIDSIGDGVWVCQPEFASGDKCNWKPLPFSSDPSAFALVKREIERRGWGWTCYRPKWKNQYMFEVSLDELTDMAVTSDSEELAGCLAVKAAVEGSK